MFSKVEKQGLAALGKGNGGAHCSAFEKNALPVVFVGMKSRKKRQTNMTGTKPVTSDQMRQVKKQRGHASGKIYANTIQSVWRRSCPLYPLENSRYQLRS